MLAALVAGAALAEGRKLPGAPKCPIFPRSSHWNQRVDNLPVHSNSDAIVRSIGLEENVHPDFGSGPVRGRPIGIPYVTVRKGQPRVPISFEYADESDRGPYPIPRGRPDRGRARLRRRPPRDRRGPRALPAVRAVRRLPGGRRRALAGRVGRRLEPALEQAAARGLDLGGRGRAADPARPGALLRGQARADRPRPARDRAGDPRRVHLPGAPRRLGLERPRPAGDGPALPPQGGLRHRRLPAPGARDPAGAQALRADHVRQRLALVHHGRAAQRLEQRRAQRPEGRSRAARSRSWTRAGCRGRGGG